MKVLDNNEVNVQCDMPGAMFRIGIVAIITALTITACSSGSDSVPQAVTQPVPTVTATVTATPEPAPTVTVTATPKPRPTKTVYVTKTVTQKPASRSNVRPNVTRGSWAQGEWGRFPAFVETAALCVAKHESWGRLWYGENPISTASGAFQWIDSTWRVNAARAGVKVTSHASYSPPRDQAKVFAWMWTHQGKKAWAGTNCPGTY